jgi:hypothetical protein
MALANKLTSPEKKPNILMEMSEEEIEEFRLCATDPIYFITNYVYIKSVEHGSIKFKLFPYQKEIIETFNENRFNVLLAARQMGKCVAQDTIIKLNSKITIGSALYPKLSLSEKIGYYRDKILQQILKIIYK